MTTVSAPVRDIAVAHSPDSDDAFMFYGLATNKVRVPGLRFSHTLTDIQTLNQQAQEGVYDVTAVSFHAYPYIQQNYMLMGCGGSVGEGYGPMVVSKKPLTPADLSLGSVRSTWHIARNEGVGADGVSGPPIEWASRGRHSRPIRPR